MATLTIFIAVTYYTQGGYVYHYQEMVDTSLAGSDRAAGQIDMGLPRRICLTPEDQVHSCRSWCYGGRQAANHLDDGQIECVSEFPYLGSLIADNGRIDAEIDKRIASASKAFGALRQPVFKDNNLSVTTKRRIYQACVMSVLLYGGECWVPLRKHLKRLNTFHQRCIRTVLDISSQRQWEERISTMMREQWGDVETIEMKLMKRRLEWLGHLARLYIITHCTG